MRADGEVAELAAVSDAELAADVRAAAAEVLERVEVWRRTADWPRSEVAPYVDVTARARVAQAALPVDASPSTLADAVRPILNAWWPSGGPAVELAAAVERLRAAAIHRPTQVKTACRLSQSP
jgi:hypothetical protein